MAKSIGYLCAALLNVSAGALSAQTADTVFLSDNILTGNVDMPSAKSLAVAGDTIVCVRLDNSCQDMAAPDATVVDAGSNTIMAGIVDTHLHTRLFGQTHAVMLNLFKYNDAPREEVLKVIRDYAATLGPDEWVIGGGWSDKHFDNPTKEELDELVGGRPALLSDNTQHNGWYSTKALDYLGINGDWQPPKGGYMELNDKGEPDGLLQEKAHLSTGFVEQHKLYSEEKQEEAIIAAARILNAVGVTAATEAAAGSKEGADDIYVRLANKGELNLRHEIAMVYWGGGGNPEDDTKMVEELKMRRQAILDAGVDPNFLASNTIKFAIDGTPGRFASMESPYLDGTHPNMNYEHDNLNEIFDTLTENGFRVMLHVEGNRAIRRSLDALEYANETGNPVDPDARNIMTHLDHIGLDSASRMAQLNVYAQLQAHWADPTEEYFVNVVKKNVRPEFLQSYNQHKLVTRFVEFGFGPDAPTSPTFSPWEGMQIAMTRQPLGGQDVEPMPGEPLSFTDVFHGSTLGGARVQRMDHIIGSLEEGKKADILVLDRDIAKQAKDDIYAFHKTEVVQTYLNGKLVYDIDRDQEPDEGLTKQTWDEGDDEKLRRGVAVTSSRANP